MNTSQLDPSPRPELEGDSFDDVLRELAHSVNLRLLALDDGSGNVRRRFLALLLATTRRQATKRITLRAQKFVAQRGLCADCGSTLDARRLPPGTLADEPLRCAECLRRPRLHHPPASSD